MHAEAISGVFRFLKPVPIPEIDHLLRHCERRQLVAGATLWDEGDTECYMGFVLSGKVGIKKRTEFGGRQVIVGILSSGSLIGEYNLLSAVPRPVSAEIIESAELLILFRQEFEHLLAQSPQLGIQLLRQISISTTMRLTQSYERLAAIF